MTAVGARVLERAARIEEDVAGITRLAEAGAGAVGGVVRITAVSALIGEWLVPRSARPVRPSSGAARRPVASNDNLNAAPRGRRRHPPGAAGERRLLIRKLAGSGFALLFMARGDLAVSAGDWVGYNEDLDHTPDAPPARHAGRGPHPPALEQPARPLCARWLAASATACPLLRRRCDPGLVMPVRRGADPVP